MRAGRLLRGRWGCSTTTSNRVRILADLGVSHFSELSEPVRQLMRRRWADVQLQLNTTQLTRASRIPGGSYACAQGGAGARGSTSISPSITWLACTPSSNEYITSSLHAKALYLCAG